MPSPTLVSSTTSAWTGAVTSRSVTGVAVQAGDVLLVKIADAGWVSGDTFTISSTGAGPSGWTERLNAGTVAGYAQAVLWTGRVYVNGSTDITVTANVAKVFGMVVEVWRNALVGNGNSVTTSSTATHMEISLLTSADHSAVSWIGTDFNNTNVGTPAWTTGVTQENFTYDTVDGYTTGAVYTADAGVAGSNNYGSTNWTTGKGTMLVMEIEYYEPVAILIGRSSQDPAPLPKARPWFADSYSAPVELLSINFAKPIFPPPDFVIPKPNTPRVYLRSQDDQDFPILSSLYQKDRVLTVTALNYKWGDPLARMPLALRADSYGVPLDILTATLTSPVGEASQDYFGRNVRLASYSYEFGLQLSIYGKDQIYGGPGQPLLNVDWPVPRRTASAVSLLSELSAGESLLTFFPTRPPINQQDWPVPLSKPSIVKDWVTGVPLEIIKYLLVFPFSQTDWPNPLPKRLAIDLLGQATFLDLSDLSRISQPPPGSALWPDYPNPTVPKRSIDLLSWYFFSYPTITTVPTSGGHVGRVVFPSKRLSDIAGLPFDFISALAPGETIVSAVVTVTMYSGIDSNPSAILNAAPITIGTVATQFVGPGSSAVGNIYTLLCKATSSLSKTYTMAGYLAIEPDVP